MAKMIPLEEGKIRTAILDCLAGIAQDYPPLKECLSGIMDIRPITRLDRKKGIERTVFVVEFARVPPPLSIEGSWIRGNIQAQLKGFLIGRLGLPYYIDVDIQAGNFPELVDTQWRVHGLSLEEALAARFIEPKSPFVPYMRKYGIREFVLSESYRILGPNIGAIKVMEQVLAHIQFECMTDLFTGTGAFILIGLQNGIKKAYGFDMDISVARNTLTAYKDQVKLIQGDTFNAELPSEMGLTVADPTMPLNLKFAHEIASTVCRRSRLLLLTHGHTEHTLWNEQIRSELALSCSHLLPIGALAMEMTICTNDDILFEKLRSIPLGDNYE